jgi:predicted metal-dependent HD superfamily phosphohydrolase
MATTEAPDDPEPDPARKTRDRLLSRWTTLLVSARDGEQEPDPVPFGRNLIERWSEPQRRYHTVDHLLDVLNRVDELAPHTRGADIDAVLLAVWFHDAVYRPDRSENEERSAALARRALPEAGVPQARTDEVARLVRLTVSHDPEPGDTNGELLCDADLAVLAGPPGEYAQYAAAVRQEYGFVPDDAFLAGRADVLRQLLGLPRLFRTPYGQDRWEHLARQNLRTEMELLVTGD